MENPVQYNFVLRNMCRAPQSTSVHYKMYEQNTSRCCFEPQTLHKAPSSTKSVQSTSQHCFGYKPCTQNSAVLLARQSPKKGFSHTTSAFHTCAKHFPMQHFHMLLRTTRLNLMQVLPCTTLYCQAYIHTRTHYTTTTITAQGGGGSCRKPIGGVGCWESWMAESTGAEKWMEWLCIYLPARQSSDLYSYLTTFISIYPPICLSLNQPIYVPIYPIAFLSTCLSISKSAHLSVYLSIWLSFSSCCLSTCLPASLST